MLVFCFVDVVEFLFLVLLVYGDVVVIDRCSCFFDVKNGFFEGTLSSKFRVKKR
jgi:hypothetical protein